MSCSPPDGSGEEVVRVSSGSPFEPTIGFVRAIRSGRRVLVSGTGPVMPDGSCPDTALAQARRCFDIALEAVAEAAAGAETRVLRTRMILTDASAAEEVGRAHAERFADAPPAATMIVVAALVDPRWLVEVELEAELVAPEEQR